MTWAKIDDQMQHHPKIMAAGPIAELLQYRAIQYCCRYLTDGFLPVKAVASLLTGLDGIGLYPSRQQREGYMAVQGHDADELDWPSIMVAHGLWESRKNGFHVHDFLEYNRSKSDVLAEREAKRSAGVKGAQSTNTRRWRSAQAPASAAASAAARADPSAGGPGDGTPSLPSPSRSTTRTKTEVEPVDRVDKSEADGLTPGHALPPSLTPDEEKGLPLIAKARGITLAQARSELLTAKLRREQEGRRS